MERKPGQIDGADAGVVANESSAATSGTSNAMTAQQIDGAAALATDVSAKTLRQAPPDDLVDTEVSVATTASQRSSADPTKRGSRGGASGQPDDVINHASSVRAARVLRQNDATEDVHAAASEAEKRRSTDRHVFNGRTLQQLETNATATQAEGTATITSNLRSVQKTDGQERLKDTGHPKTPKSTGRTSRRQKP